MNYIYCSTVTVKLAQSIKNSQHFFYPGSFSLSLIFHTSMNYSHCSNVTVKHVYS